MPESKFKELQEDVCYKEPEETVEADIKICPDCIPNPNLPEINNWDQNFTPYFSERDCEYHCTIIANIEGNIHYAKPSTTLPNLNGSDFSVSEEQEILEEAGPGSDPENISKNSGPRQMKAIEDSQYDFDTLLKSYIRPAIRKTLRHFGKLETDEIVCASPPENPGEICEGVFGLDYERFIEVTEIPTGEPIPNYFELLEVNESIKDTFPNITNTKALELFARVKDYKFVTANKVLYVQISIPSYKFNQIPDAPVLGSIDTGAEKIVLNTTEFVSQIQKFKSAMNVFAGYQAYFYRQENGRLFFQETQEPFYIKFFSEDGGRIDSFMDKLSQLMLNNGFFIKRYDFENFTKDFAGEIEITFDKSNPELPFKVLNVRARKVGATSGLTENILSQATTNPVPTRFINCPFVDCTEGLSDFIEYSEFNQTMMGYVSDIRAISGQLQSNVTPPWLDFTIEKTFPKLGTNFGSMANFEDASCINVNLDDLADFIHDSVFDAFQAFSYAWNQNRCKTVEEIGKLEWNVFLDGWNDAISSGAGSSFKDAWRSRVQEPFRGITDTSTWKNAFSVSTNYEGNFKQALISLLNPCEIEKLLSGAMICFASALTLDELYYTLFKQALDAVGAEALRIVMNTLPADKAAKIEEAINEQFEGMPYPWEEGWVGGSLEAAIDRNVVDAQGKTTEASSDYEDIEEKLKKEKEILAKYQEIAEASGTALTNLVEADSAYIEGQAYVARSLELLEFLSGETLNPNGQFEVVPGGFNQIRTYEEQVVNLKRQKVLQEGAIQTTQGQINELSNSSDVTDQLNLARLENALEEQKQENIRITSNLLSVELQLEKAREELKELKKELKKDKFKITVSPEAYKEHVIKSIPPTKKRIRKLENDLKKKEDTIINLTKNKNWENLTEEQKLQAAEDQQRKTFNVKTRSSDEIEQGTFGTALGNIQQLLTQAYIEEIMNNITIVEIQELYEKIPGANLIAKLVPQFACPTEENLIYPKIDNFLSTLTFDPCSTLETKISLPSISELKTSFNWLEMLADAFIAALKKLISAVLMALMQKVAEILENSLDFCDLAGDLISNLTSDPNEGFERFLDDVLCQDPKQQDDKDRLYRNLADKAVGYPTANAAKSGEQRSSVGLMKTISALSTQGEVKAAMVGRADDKYLNNIGNIVKELNPEYAKFFSDPTRTSQFFASMGNFLTPEQRSNIISELDNPSLNRQPEESICLSKEDKDRWNLARQQAFADPEVGRKFVDQENDRLNKNVADAAKMLMSGGIEGQLQDALEQAFAPKDQDCEVNQGLVPTVKDYPESVQNTVSNAITGIFKRLEKAFIDDTIEWNFFSNFFSSPLGTNTPGVLSVILSNNKSNTLNYHMAVTKNPILSFLLNGAEMALPVTVGSQMRNYIENNLKIDYKIDKELELKYDNERVDNQRFQSELIVDESFSVALAYNIKDKQDNINILVENPSPYESGYEINPSEPGNSRSKSLYSMLESIFFEFPEFSLQDGNTELIGMNNILYKNLSKALIYRRGEQVSEGFLYGNQNTPILEDSDLVYVNPEPGSTEYTYSEEDRVLGRSLTNNPRVHFLDPEQFGGTYAAPNIYISEATHRGWLGFSKLIVPNPTGCDPKNSNFLYLGKLIKHIEDREGKIQNHELLEYSPECTFEVPFDKVANSNTLATLEGIVRATCRVHIVDFLIRSYPIFSNVHLDMDLNFNNILLDYISEKVARGLIEERSIFATTYEGYTYFLLFMEQVAQTMKREVSNGNIETNQEIEKIFEKINEAQVLHKQECFITEKNLKYVNDPSSFPSVTGNANVSSVELDGVEGNRSKFQTMNNIMKQGIALIGQNSDYDFLRAIENWDWFGLVGVNLTQARFACKIYRINTLRSDLQKLLKYIVKQEFELYREELLRNLSPRPHIYDISKFFIGGSNVLLGKTVDAGTYDTEFPIGGGIGEFPYGNVNDCPDENLNHPLNGVSVTQEQYDEIIENGGFYLEKYVKCKEKKGVFRNFPAKLEGVTQIKELKSFLRSELFSGQLEGTEFVSDCFGDAEISEDGATFTGEIGIKFGVRLCFIPSRKTDIPTSDLTRETRSFRIKQASLLVNGQNKAVPNSRFSFPICSYELDILDVKIQDLLSSNDLLNQDLKCYIDKLVETNNFKHLMENVLDVKKIPSIFMIYSYKNFLLSLGAGQDERKEGQDGLDIPSDRVSKIFNDCRAECRRIFASYYKNDDRDPPNEEQNNEDVLQKISRDILNSLSFINFGDFSFDIRRRLKTENPFDKNGEPCKNAFSSLYKINR